MQKLRVLDLGYNQLIGGILTALENLSSLNYLYLDQNNLTGLVPSQGIMFIPLTKNLTYIFFLSSQISPYSKIKSLHMLTDGLAKLNHFFSLASQISYQLKSFRAQL